MATEQRRKTLEDLTPEEQAKLKAARAKWDTPEAREAEIHDREALAEEYRQTGRIAMTGDPVDPSDDLHFRKFVDRLRGHREALGLSLAVVSERSGIDQAALSRLENGRGNPTVHTLSRYARAIGVRLAWDFDALNAPTTPSAASRAE
jgi:ribosome-binding protein aMBF1 (putative translation factor)